MLSICTLFFSLPRRLSDLVFNEHKSPGNEIVIYVQSYSDPKKYSIIYMLSSCFSFPLDATAIYNDIKKSRDPRSGILQIDGFWQNLFFYIF